MRTHQPCKEMVGGSIQEEEHGANLEGMKGLGVFELKKKATMAEEGRGKWCE